MPLQATTDPCGSPLAWAQCNGNAKVDEEDAIVDALLRVAQRAGVEERAMMHPVERRGGEQEDAERIAREHGLATTTNRNAWPGS